MKIYITVALLLGVLIISMLLDNSQEISIKTKSEIALEKKYKYNPKDTIVNYTTKKTILKKEKILRSIVRASIVSEYDDGGSEQFIFDIENSIEELSNEANINCEISYEEQEKLKTFQQEFELQESNIIKLQNRMLISFNDNQDSFLSNDY